MSDDIDTKLLQIDNTPDWAKEGYDPTATENSSRYIQPLYSELLDFYKKIEKPGFKVFDTDQPTGFNFNVDEEGNPITDDQTGSASRVEPAPPPSETAVSPYLLSSPPPSETAVVPRAAQPSAATSTTPRSATPPSSTPAATQRSTPVSQRSAAPESGFLGKLFSGPDYQSNNRPVIENGQINWGDPNNPADIARASKAQTAMLYGGEKPTDKGVQSHIAYMNPQKSSGTAMAYAPSDGQTPAPFNGVRQQGQGPQIKLPFIADDLSPYATYARAGEPLQSVDAVVFHHTGGYGSPRDIVNVLNQRGLGVQYVMDRDGSIYQTLPNGSRGAHIKPSEVSKITNANAIGIEMIAKDDDDVTPAQVKAAKQFYAALREQFPDIQPMGHGEINSHKMAREGMSVVDTLRSLYGVEPNFRPLRRAPINATAARAEGGRIKLLQDEFPTHYMPHVGRQVMADGGETVYPEITKSALQMLNELEGRQFDPVEVAKTVTPISPSASLKPLDENSMLYGEAADVKPSEMPYGEQMKNVWETVKPTPEGTRDASVIAGAGVAGAPMDVLGLAHGARQLAAGRIPSSEEMRVPFGSHDLEERAKAAGLMSEHPSVGAQLSGNTFSVMTDPATVFSKLKYLAVAPMVAKAEDAAKAVSLAREMQSISSADTSLNQVPALFKSKHFDAPEGARNLDIGGGKYDKGTEYLANERKVESHVYDPFNRSEDHNARVLGDFAENPADTVTAANVLNVIKEPEARLQVIQQAYDNLRPGGKAFFDIYEGDRSGAGRETSKGWQNNTKAKEFEKEILSVFPDVQRKGTTLIATKPAASEETSALEMAAKAADEGSAERAVELAKKVGAQPHNIDIPKAPSLSLEEREIETRLANKIAADPHAAMAEYAALKETDNGKILNTDNARELSPDYAASMDAKSRYSAAVHEPASWLTKWMYEQKLKQPPAAGEQPMVLFTAGGTGAGKTSAVENIPEMNSLAKSAQIIFDTNMNGYASSKKKIDQALEAGKEVGVVYVYRDPVEALENGALPRAMRIGRTVPLNEHLKTHVESANTIRQLAADYADNPNVVFQVIDNSRGRGNAAMTGIDAIQPERYKVTMDQLKSALDNAYANGKISKSVYEGTLGKLAP